MFDICADFQDGRRMRFDIVTGHNKRIYSPELAKRESFLYKK